MQMGCCQNSLRLFYKIIDLYIDGFKNMRLGRTLWAIIAIKFVIFFVIMKMLFFPNFLETEFSNDTERANHVLQNLTIGGNE